MRYAAFPAKSAEYGLTPVFPMNGAEHSALNETEPDTSLTNMPKRCTARATGALQQRAGLGGAEVYTRVLARAGQPVAGS